MLGELAALLPGCSIELSLVGPDVPQALDAQERLLGEPTVRYLVLCAGQFALLCSLPMQGLHDRRLFLQVAAG